MGSKSGELLWVVPKWPLPAEDGARVATTNLLKGLVAEGYPIDLLAVVPGDERPDLGEAIDRLGVRNIYIVRRGAAAVGRLRKSAEYAAGLLTQPATPLTMLPYNRSHVRRALGSFFCGGAPAFDDAIVRNGAESDGRWRTIVYDGLHVAIHGATAGIYRRAHNSPKVIYRAHNREADIWKRKAQQLKPGPLRSFFAYQADRVRSFENSLLAASSGIAPVSPEDLKAFERDTPLPEHRVVPIGYDFGTPSSFPADGSMQIMFLGRLDWKPNSEGLRWFLDRVWPRVKEQRADLKLAIAGSGKSEWLEAYRGMRDVTLLGRVPEVSDLYAKSALSVVPVFYGSGTRVKVIEASRFCRPCLSTAIGVEGTGLTPGDDYIRAENEDDWVQALVRCSPEMLAKVGRAAYERMRQTFAIEASARRFADLLEAI